jgi:hypothetical protein
MGCIALASRLQDIIKFRTPPANAALDRDALPYLLKQLAAVNFDRAEYEQLRIRSRHLKEVEGKDRKSRWRALERSGFQAVRPVT